MISNEFIKGLIKPIILKLLEENGKMYGYEITRKVEELTESKIKLTFGALYPILHKLEADGTVITETLMFNNRARVYYLLSSKGKVSAREKIAELEEFIKTLGKLINPETSISPCTT
ncbi:MAG: PadR family transcriptional regulator [Bacteroidales bacterium]